ncbi:MAG TPA: MFS transporter [Gammaproteobacteria bacterium]|nr:MFS transporter [Arenicellales bacterium]HCF73343.1 MFS transporter [Gammaproteobacteria bacterium]|tara:strand:- start:10933 stop:12207 length:1275 start_codon:yes stop_codon:yes gene_type:complete
MNPAGRLRNGLHYGWIILVVATLVAFGALGLARFGYSVLLPAMQADLGMGNTEAGFLATAHVIGYLVASLIGGALASRFGPRRVITVGLAIAGSSMLMTGLAGDYAEIALWRGLAGVGSGMSNIPIYGVLAAWFGTRRRGLATGIAVSGASVAFIALGPLVPIVLDEFGTLGWRICWYGFGGFTIFLAVTGAWLLRNQPQDKGLQAISAGPADDAVGQQFQKQGLEWRRVYRSAVAWKLGLVYIAFGFSYIIFITFFFKMLVAEGGYSTAEAGTLFMFMGWCSLFCGLIWGTLSDVVGRRFALTMVYLVQASAYGLVSLWPVTTGFILATLLFGLTAWSIPGIMAAACGDVFGHRLAPAALGFITLFFGLGQAVSPAVAGAMADASGSFTSAFLLASTVAILGAVGSLLLPGDRRPDSATVSRP